MATKNLVPRADSEGKLGLKIDGSDRRWLEVNAISGSFNQAKIDELLNTGGNPFFVAGTNITITSGSTGPSGYQYTISSTATGSSADADKIIEGDSSVEIVDTASASKINFTLDGTEVWKIEDTTGHLKPYGATTDIGEVNNRVRNLYLSDSGIKLATGDISLDTSTKRLKYTHSSVDNVLPLTKVVRAASSAELSGFTYNAGVFTESSATGALTFDTNVVLVNGDRVLLKNQSTTLQNGIYVVAGIDGSSAVTLTRANDFATSQSFANIIVNVREGSANSGNLYHSLLASNGDSVIGTTNQLWVQINNEGITFGNLSDIGADLADADKFIVDDGGNGTTRESTLLRLKKYIFSAISGDATASDTGALTIAAGAVENSMLANSSITFGSTAVALGGTVSIQGTSNEVEVSESSGTFTIGLPSATAITTSLTVPTINLSGQSSALALNSQKITNLATPTAGTDAATKAYVDSVAQGLTINNAVRAATTEPLVLANAFENGDTIDGITLATGNRILIKDQATASENGIYIVQASGAPTRATDMAASSSAAGIFMFVQEGTANGDKGFVCTSNSGSDVVGTNNLTFTQFSGAGQITAGNGLVLNGSAFDINLDTTATGGLNLSSDQLQVKALGITNAMLAGSISDNKLNQITTADKVALTSLDIDGGTQLTELADSDLFIVDDGASGSNKKMAASVLKGHVLSGITGGDATVNASGLLTISNDAIEAGMLNDNIISGQDVIPNPVDGTNDFLLIHDGSGPSIKKISVNNLVSGLSVDNVDITSKSALTAAAIGDELLISDIDDSGTNKKITAANLVTHQNLMPNIIRLSNSNLTASDVLPNSLVLLDNSISSSNVTYTIKFKAASNAVDGDRIQIRIINIATTGFNANTVVVKRVRISIDGTTNYINELNPLLFLNDGVEFIYDGVTSSWQHNSIGTSFENTTSSVINLDESIRKNEYITRILKGTSNTVTINLPSQTRISNVQFKNNTEFKFFVGSTSIKNITFVSTDEVGSSDALILPTMSSTSAVETLTIQPQPLTTVKAVLRDIDGNGTLRYVLEYVKENAEQTSELPSNPDANDVLVYKNNVWAAEKITNSNIDNSADIAITKLQKINAMSVLGHVDGGAFTDGDESVNEVKVFKSVDDLRSEIIANTVNENSSLITSDGIVSYIDQQIEALSSTEASSNKNFYYVDINENTLPGGIITLPDDDTIYDATSGGNPVAHVVVRVGRWRRHYVNLDVNSGALNFLNGKDYYLYPFGFAATMGIELPKLSNNTRYSFTQHRINFYIISTIDVAGLSLGSYTKAHVPPAIKVFPNRNESAIINRVLTYTNNDIVVAGLNATETANVNGSNFISNAGGASIFNSAIQGGPADFYGSNKMFNTVDDYLNTLGSTTNINQYYQHQWAKSGGSLGSGNLAFLTTNDYPVAPILGYSPTIKSGDQNTKCTRWEFTSNVRSIKNVDISGTIYKTQQVYWTNNAYASGIVESLPQGVDITP